MSASTPALPSVPTASGKRKGRSRRKPAALPVSPLHHPPQSLSDAVFSVESTDDAGSSLGKPRGSHTMPNLVSAPSFHFASRFNTGLGRERRPQGARELAHVCNELPAESPRQAALRDAALARVRMRQSEGVRRFDSSSLDTGSGLSTWAAYSDSGASRPALPDDHSAAHADVSWTSVPAGDLDLARHVERKRLQNGFSMELPVAASIDASAYEGKPSRTTGEHRAVGRRSSDLSSLISDGGSRPKRSRTKQRQQRQRRRRGEASRLYPGMSAADSVIVQDHSRRHKVRATRMVSWGDSTPLSCELVANHPGHIPIPVAQVARIPAAWLAWLGVHVVVACYRVGGVGRRRVVGQSQLPGPPCQPWEHVSAQHTATEPSTQHHCRGKAGYGWVGCRRGRRRW